MKRREFNKTLSAAIAVILSPLSRARRAWAAGGATPVFDYSNGFATAGTAISYKNSAGLSGSRIVMFGNTGHNSAGVWYATKQPPTAFTTQFTFQMTGLGTTIDDSGLTFCIQNTVSPPGAPGYVGAGYAGDANMCGYGGAINQTPPVDSIAIKFDCSNIDGQHYPAGGKPNSTGLYFNGGPSVVGGTGGLGLIPLNDLNPYGIDFYDGNTHQVTIVYDGSLLTMVLLDTVTNAQARFVWPLNLANTTNSTGNYVGFTGGTASVGTFYFSSWSYWSGYDTRLATPTFSPAPGQYAGKQTVTLVHPAGSSCYYTTNGLLPTSASTPYSGPITVSANEIIQAVATQSGFTDSLVATGAYQIGTPNVINFPSGFSDTSLVKVGIAYLSGSAVRVTDTTTGTSGAAWFPGLVTVSKFTTSFTLQWGANGQGTSGQGMCFVIQNNPPPYQSTTGNKINWAGGPTALGNSGGALGYGGSNDSAGNNGNAFGLLTSVAIVFNQYAGKSPDPPANSVGLCTQGTIAYGMGVPATSFASTGLTFSSGHPFDVSLTYSGTTLSLSVTDTVTGNPFTHDFPIDIPSTVGAGTAYVGFTGGTGGAASIQAVTAWTYTASPVPGSAVPNAPTNLKVH